MRDKLSQEEYFVLKAVNYANKRGLEYTLSKCPHHLPITGENWRGQTDDPELYDVRVKFIKYSMKMPIPEDKSEKLAEITAVFNSKGIIVGELVGDNKIDYTKNPLNTLK